MMEPAPLLEWLARHPQSYLWLTGGLLGLAFGLAAAPLLRAGPEVTTRRHDWAWGPLLLAILAAGRWPSWLASIQLNVDESQLLAGAHALTVDPVFWRSVNGGTAGPLDFFALWPAGWLCGWQGYLAARLTAFALVGISLVLAHQVMALVVGRRVARIASLATVAFEALTNAPDFLHYSTELVPAALLAGAAYAAVRRWALQDDPLWNGLGAVLLGAVPLAKLQPLPLAAVMGLAWLWAELRTPAPDRPRRLAYLVLGALTPAALFAAQLTIAGEWRSFVTAYFLYNLNYAAAGSRVFGQMLREIWANSIWWDSLLHLWLPGLGLWFIFMLRLRPVPDRTLRIFTWASGAAVLITLGSIVSPGRPFLHYWQLFVVPAGCLLGAMIARLLSTSPSAGRKSEPWLVVLCAAGLLGALLLHRVEFPNAFIRGLAHYREKPRTPLADRVAAHARPGERIAIWGWTNEIYVETGLLQATRDPHVGALLEPGPLQPYFRERYLADFLRARPELFLDSVGPASLNYVAPQFAHDRNYPALAAVIRADYVLVETAQGARIYRRKDR